VKSEEFLMQRQLTILCLICALISGLVPETGIGAEPQVELLWPNGAPGATSTADTEVLKNGHLRNVHKPALTIYLPPPAKATGAAVVICPGGGYGILAADHEGKQVAEWLNALGVAGFILTYRHSPYRHPIPLMDAQRAISTVRYRSREWGVDPTRIGILGFSAGGHLASTAGTHFAVENIDAKDPIDRTSNRPDFMVLVYPVISFTAEYTHKGSRANLLGRNPDKELVKSLSNELQVTAQTPPTFLVHADDDRGVPSENSVCFYLALRKATVPAEMHIYLKGGHGFGLRPNSCVAAADWPRRCADWLREQGFLKKKSG
jgi:acetyl esterase/lipase